MTKLAERASSSVLPDADRITEAAASQVNALSVDVEEYFQVHAFSGVVERSQWETLPGRVATGTDLLLDLMAERGVSGTFFTLGWIAERNPRLIRRIADAGHEVASHGWEHVPVYSQTPGEFRADIRRTREMLEDASGQAVSGYRAASFSIDQRTPWAHEVLAEEGYRYSSSIYPVRHDHYGMVSAPRFPFRPRGRDGVVELPITTTKLKGSNLPCGGGGYFRLLPYAASRWLMRRVNDDDRQPCIFYCHPWEFDPAQPRMKGVRLKSRFRHYVNLGRTAPRLRRLLADFAWDRMDRVFRADIDSAR